MFTCFLKLFITPMILDSNLYSSLDAIFFSLFFLGANVFSHGVAAMLIMLYCVYDQNVYLINTELSRAALHVNMKDGNDVKEATGFHDGRLGMDAIKVHFNFKVKKKKKKGLHIYGSFNLQTEFYLFISFFSLFEYFKYTNSFGGKFI